jgi:hypothetical protein
MTITIEQAIITDAVRISVASDLIVAAARNALGTASSERNDLQDAAIWVWENVPASHLVRHLDAAKQDAGIPASAYACLVSENEKIAWGNFLAAEYCDADHD